MNELRMFISSNEVAFFIYLLFFCEFVLRQQIRNVLKHVVMQILYFRPDFLLFTSFSYKKNI